MIIGIDMGHCLSGEGTGAKGCGHREEIETRNIGKIVIDMLKQEGNTVIDCTVDRARNNSAQLNERVSKANKQKLDLFVSIHFNACVDDEKGNGKTTGTEAFIYSTNSKAKPYAEMIVKNLSSLGLKNRGIKLSKEAAKGGIAVVDKTTSPALLVECCFIDDIDDMNLYTPQKFAKAIVEGILNKRIIENTQGSSSEKHYSNCVLYGNDVDRVGAEVIGWSKEDCIVKHVKDHIKWEATNLFTVGGPATEVLQKLNNGEKFGIIKGDNRYDTVRKCLEFVGK
ncbi:N-acetylmuramoyl-L-alanine amidase [Romboutsia lituseburensis]|uniref:N-acetylmuramoyl-L-alanine amidase n=1 Tax=Romboutsia lituseburensis TaxID=1537 RepID=UPI0022EAD060|nr:N-acetylmuramoyl-L-alanine amidase [Romboutsia lituseburensis]